MTPADEAYLADPHIRAHGRTHVETADLHHPAIRNRIDADWAAVDTTAIGDALDKGRQQVAATETGITVDATSVEIVLFILIVALILTCVLGVVVAQCVIHLGWVATAVAAVVLVRGFCWWMGQS
jgi:hypothetical protein